MQSLLLPYVHELDSAGRGCAEDCPACRWVAEELEPLQAAAKFKKMPGRVVVVLPENVVHA